MCRPIKSINWYFTDCKYKNANIKITCSVYITNKICTWLNNKLNWYNIINVCLTFFTEIRNFAISFYPPEARMKFFLPSMFSFYCLHVHWKETLFEQFFYFRKLFPKTKCSFSFCCAPSMFLFCWSHVL